MKTRSKTPCELLHEFPFFAGLDEATYDALLARARERHYDRDETLFHEGERCTGLYLVQTGLVKVFKVSDQGREQILALAMPGDSVAELPLFDGGDYPASAAAMEPTDILFIPSDAFHALLAERPQLATAVIAALATRMRKLVGLVADLSLRQVRQRLARYLSAEAGGRASIPLALTNDELAARLGSVRDVISRTLSGLQADGFIRLHGRTVEILDPEGLRDEGE